MRKRKKIKFTSLRVLNGLDPDQDQHLVGPDLCPICLQRLPDRLATV